MERKLLPWSFQFEIVEGCNRACSFCGIHGVRGKNGVGPLDLYKYMDINLFDEMSKQINTWQPRRRIEFNNHGEPTLHPQWLAILSLARKNMPRASLQLQTNMRVAMVHSDPLQYVKEHFNRGLNIFVANCYDKRIFKLFQEWHKDGYLQDALGDDVRVIDYYYGDRTPTDSMYHYKYGKKFFFLMDNLARVQKKIRGQGSARFIFNESGNSIGRVIEKLTGKPAVVEEPLKKFCTRVFRELIVGWNGVVCGCCYDWSNGLVFGDLSNESVKDVWFGEAWQITRRLLSPETRYRNISPCDVCNYGGGFRPGFLAKVEPFKDDKEIKAACTKLRRHLKRYKAFQYPNRSYHVGGRVYNDGTGYEFEG